MIAGLSEGTLPIRTKPYVAVELKTETVIELSENAEEELNDPDKFCPILSGIKIESLEHEVKQKEGELEEKDDELKKKTAELKKKDAELKKMLAELEEMTAKLETMSTTAKQEVRRAQMFQQKYAADQKRISELTRTVKDKNEEMETQSRKAKHELNDLAGDVQNAWVLRKSKTQPGAWYRVERD